MFCFGPKSLNKTCVAELLWMLGGDDGDFNTAGVWVMLCYVMFKTAVLYMTAKDLVLSPHCVSIIQKLLEQSNWGLQMHSKTNLSY